MKIKILKIAFVAAVAMVSGMNMFNDQKLETLSDVAWANVEALADEEVQSDCIVYCKTDKRYSCYIDWDNDTEIIACRQQRKA